jgi:hypothetical protein
MLNERNDEEPDWNQNKSIWLFYKNKQFQQLIKQKL